MIAATSAARDSESMNATAHSGITASAATRQRPFSTAAMPAQNGTTSAHQRPSWWRLSNEPNSSSLPSLKLNGCRAAIARSFAAGPMTSRRSAYADDQQRDRDDALADRRQAVCVEAAGADQHDGQEVQPGRDERVQAEAQRRRGDAPARA